MKKSSFALFFAAFFTVYGLVNLAIFQWGLSALSRGSVARTVYVCAFIVLSCSFIAGRLLERVRVSRFVEALIWIGSFWLGAMLYLFLAVLLYHALSFAAWLVPATRDSLYVFLQERRAPIVAGISAGVLVLLAGGFLNARRPRVRTLELTIRKHVSGSRRMILAVASDIHLGTLVGGRQLDRMIAMINDMHADIVLLPGDIVDEDLGPVIRENLGERLRTIRARMGVAAVTGNHEYIGGAEAACAYLADHGVLMLRDAMLRLENGVQVIGREDRSSAQFAGKRREKLEDLVAGADKALPVIVMDHQPFHLEEAERCGIDLQLSGHTHHGQLWPLSFITKAVYEASRGYLRKGATHIYVSPGAGTWGPPVRIGNRPEIVKVVLTFEP